MAQTSTERQKRTFRTRLWLVTAAVLVCVLFAAAYAVFVRPSALVGYVTGRVLPKVSQSLGRSVTVESVRARVFPSPSVRLFGLKIEGAQGEPPLVQSPETDAAISLWPLLRSFGKEIEISGLRFKGTALNLVRRADGTWNYEDLGKKSGPSDSAPSGRSFLIENFDVSDASVHFTDLAQGRKAEVPLTKISAHAQDIEIDKPLRMDLAAALDAAQTNITARFELSRLPAGKEDLSENGYPDVKGSFALHGIRLEAFRGYFPANLASLVHGGIIDATGEVSTPTAGGVKRYGLEGSAKLHQLTLRSQPAQGSLSFNVQVDPARPQGARVAIRQLALQGPGLEMGGSIDATLQPVNVSFDLSGPLLDLPQLLAVVPSSPKKEEKPADQPLLSPEKRTQLAEAKVNGKVSIDRVVNGKLEATQLKARVGLQKGVLAFSQGSAQLYGGQLRIDGTKVDLKPEKPTWELNAQLAQLDMGQAFNSLSAAQPVRGKLNGKLNLSGAGAAWDQIRQDVNGSGNVDLNQGALTAVDLGGELANALSVGLRALNRPGVAENVQHAGNAGTALNDLKASFTVRDGWIQLNKPLAASTSFGGATLGGKIGLDQRLALDGTAQLQPEFLAKTIGPSVAPKSPVSVPLKIEGTLKAPKVGVDPTALAKSMLRPENLPAPVQEKAKSLEEEARARARRGLGGLLNRPTQ